LVKVVQPPLFGKGATFAGFFLLGDLEEASPPFLRLATGGFGFALLDLLLLDLLRLDLLLLLLDFDFLPLLLPLRGDLLFLLL
jgi:hypothetical protein